MEKNSSTKTQTKSRKIKFRRRLVTICGILNLTVGGGTLPLCQSRGHGNIIHKTSGRPPLSREKGKGNWIRLTLSYTNEDEQPHRIL